VEAVIGQVKGSLTVGERSFSLDHPLTTEDFSMESDEISALIGDGNARVNVSLGMSDKSYGTGFDAHVSISLTCDQESAIIGVAYEFASEIAKEKLSEVMEQAKEMWKEYEPET
jgi:hypothetical protein